MEVAFFSDLAACDEDGNSESPTDAPLRAYRSSSRVNGISIIDPDHRLAAPLSEGELLTPYRPRMTAVEAEARAAAISAVSREDRELLMRRHLDLTPVRNIAKYADMTYPAMRQRLSRAEKRMRREYGKHFVATCHKMRDEVAKMAGEVKEGIRPPYRFNDGARLAGLSPRVAYISALVLRYAGWPVTYNGLMADADVRFLREWHSPALHAYHATVSGKPRTGWSRYRIAGERLRQRYESQVAVAA